MSNFDAGMTLPNKQSILQYTISIFKTKFLCNLENSCYVKIFIGEHESNFGTKRTNLTIFLVYDFML